MTADAPTGITDKDGFAIDWPTPTVDAPTGMADEDYSAIE
jgi:hypothetical protein